MILPPPPGRPVLFENDEVREKIIRKLDHDNWHALLEVADFLGDEREALIRLTDYSSSNQSDRAANLRAVLRAIPTRTAPTKHFNERLAAVLREADRITEIQQRAGRLARDFLLGMLVVAVCSFAIALCLTQLPGWNRVLALIPLGPTYMTWFYLTNQAKMLHGNVLLLIPREPGKLFYVFLNELNAEPARFFTTPKCEAGKEAPEQHLPA